MIQTEAQEIWCKKMVVSGFEHLRIHVLDLFRVSDL